MYISSIQLKLFSYLYSLPHKIYWNLRLLADNSLQKNVTDLKQYIDGGMGMIPSCFFSYHNGLKKKYSWNIWKYQQNAGVEYTAINLEIAIKKNSHRSQCLCTLWIYHDRNVSEVLIDLICVCKLFGVIGQILKLLRFFPEGWILSKK